MPSPEASLSDPSSVIPSDPTKPFTTPPLIADIVRTRYCIPGSVFLVEGIDPSIPVSKRYRTVRLLLGDGELCMQALLQTEMHSFVDSGQVYLGSYVRLSSCEVRSLQLSQEGGLHVEGPDPNELIYLVVNDMTTVGWNTAYMEIAGVHKDATHSATDSPNHLGLPAAETSISEDDRPQNAEAGEPVLADQGTENSDADDGFETMEVSEEKASERREMGKLIRHSASSSSTNLPWTSDDPTQPVKLTPLRSIPHLPYKQNWIVNVLAVVTSLSDVEPATLPPYKQRIARIADPTTSKHVHLTVFRDPEQFAPKIGSVVLLLGVKNHRFDGGSLKKYGNERAKKDSRWWFENPLELEWCDVASLQHWWDTKSS